MSILAASNSVSRSLSDPSNQSLIPFVSEESYNYLAIGAIALAILGAGIAWANSTTSTYVAQLRAQKFAHGLHLLLGAGVVATVLFQADFSSLTSNLEIVAKAIGVLFLVNVCLACLRRAFVS